MKYLSIIRTTVHTKYLFFLRYFKYKISGVNNQDSINFYLSKNESPSLEVSVKVGCGLFCTYCPQSNYIESFKNRYAKDYKVLSKMVFQSAMKNVDTNTLIKWTGFTEPLDSKNFPFFCEYLKNNSYRQSISTTLKGTTKSVRWFVDNIALFSAVTLHLPDSDGLMKCKVDGEYINNLYKVLEVRKNKNLQVFLIGKSFQSDVLKVIENCIRDGILNKKNITYAKVLNTRNLSIDAESTGLTNIQFRDKISDTKKQKKDSYYCAYRRLNQGVLLPNGRVTLCCQDYKLEYILGDLKNEKLDDLYNKIQTSEIDNNLFLSGDFYPCTKCEHYRTIDNSFTGHL
jgi:organic radical activating enzyme